MDPQSDNDQTIAELQQGIRDVHVTNPETPSTRNYDAELRKNITAALKVVSTVLENLKELEAKVNVPSKRSSEVEKKAKVETILTPDLIRPECHGLIDGFTTFTLTNLKSAIKNRFAGKVLRTNLESPTILGLTQAEYEIHQAAVKYNIPALTINDKDVVTIAQRVFVPPKTYQVTTEKGEVVELNVGALVGKTRSEIIDILELHKWCRLPDYGNNRVTVSPYLFQVLDQVPSLKSLNLLDKQESYATTEGFAKLIDIIRDTYSIYDSYVETPSSKTLVEQLQLDIYNNCYKIDQAIARAKAAKYITSPKESDKIRNALRGVTEEHSLI